MKNDETEKQFAAFLRNQENNSQNSFQNNSEQNENLQKSNLEFDKTQNEKMENKKIENSKTRSGNLENSENVAQNTSNPPNQNIQLNFQISQFYIFALIAISVIILNIAVWSLAYTLLEFFGFFVYLFGALMANLKIPFPYFEYQDFLNSSSLRSLVLIIFVFANYKLHAKFLKKIFESLEIK